MKKLLHKLTMGDCSQLLILEARRIMRAIEILGQIDYMEQIGVPRHRLLVHLQSNGPPRSSAVRHHSPSSQEIKLALSECSYWGTKVTISK